MTQASPPPELPQGVLAHACPERTRVRFPDRRGDTGFFQSLCERVVELPGVRGVEGRTETGSLIIDHDVPSEDVLRAALDAGLFAVGEATPVESAAVYAGEWKNTLDGALTSISGGGIDLKTLAALAFLLMAIRQFARGQIAPPAAGALWYGLTLLLMNHSGADLGPGTGDGGE